MGTDPIGHSRFVSIVYRWSRYAANAAGKPVAWLTPHGEYLALGLEDERRQAAYRGLFATELDPQLLREIRVSTHGGYAIGSGRFREEIETALRLRATPRGPGRPARTPGVNTRGQTPGKTTASRSAA